jgi:hypothetical protein
MTSLRSNSGKEIKKRIGTSWNKCKSLGFILADKFQELEIKKDVLEPCVLPVVLYGAQTGSLTEKEKKVLQNCLLKIDRRILHVVRTDRMPSAEI